MYDDYSTSYTAGTEVTVGAVLLFLLVVFALSSVLWVSLWAIYKKAGKPGWAVFVPIYGQYVFSEIILGNGLFFLIYYIPYLNVVAPFIFGFLLASAFNKSKLFALGLIFLPLIFYPILAFSSDSYYKGPYLINDHFTSGGKGQNNYYNQQNNQYYGQNNDYNNQSANNYYNQNNTYSTPSANGYYGQNNEVNNNNNYYNQNNNQF